MTGEIKGIESTSNCGYIRSSSVRFWLLVLRREVILPWGIDYVDLCNMRRSDVDTLVRKQDWFYRNPSYLERGRIIRDEPNVLKIVPEESPDPSTLEPYKRGIKKFSHQELDDVWESIQQFRTIVVKWAKDVKLSVEDKYTLLVELVDVRNGRLKDGTGTVMPGVHFWYSFPPAHESSILENFRLTETVDENDLRLICYSLYQELYEDLQATTQNHRPKPRICALGAEPGSHQKSCERLFRPKPVGRGAKFCSDKCRSTNSSRNHGKKKRVEYLKYSD
jgi:hypothetical protein